MRLMTLEELIRQEATKRGIDPRVALSLIAQESGANTRAVGDGGQAVGLGQLHPRAAMDAGIDPARRTDPFAGAAGSMEYLRQQLVRSQGDYNKALSFYNQGPGNYNPAGVGYGNRIIRAANGMRGGMGIGDALDELGVTPAPQPQQDGGMSLDDALGEVMGAAAPPMAQGDPGSGTIPIDPNAHETPESPPGGDTRLMRDLMGMAQQGLGSGAPAALSALVRAAPLAYGAEQEIGHWSTRQPRDASGRFTPRVVGGRDHQPVVPEAPAPVGKSKIPWWAPWGTSLIGHPYIGLGLRALRQYQMRKPPMGE